MVKSKYIHNEAVLMEILSDSNYKIMDTDSKRKKWEVTKWS